MEGAAGDIRTKENFAEADENDECFDFDDVAVDAIEAGRRVRALPILSLHGSMEPECRP